MLAALLMSVSALAGCSSKKEQLQADGYISSLEISSTIDYVNTAYIKSPQHANPISSEMFCADPTAIEYNGRLYVFGTNSCFREAASDSTTGSSFNKSTQPSKSLISKTVCGYYNICYENAVLISRQSRPPQSGEHIFQGSLSRPNL